MSTVMKIFLFLASIFFPLAAFCQNEDYLVKTNGDTIRGSIELKNKTFEISGPAKEYVNAPDVKTIKSKKYNGETVVPCTLQLYTDNMHLLEFGYDAQGHVDTVMILKKIFSSPKMDLYFGKDKYKSQYYFYQTPSDSLPVQLVIRYHLDGGLDNYGKDPGKYSGSSSAVFLTEDKGYVNQLHFFMGDCKKINDAMWELLSYRDYSLIELIKKYNKCK